ncbi:sensor histidine kinase [Tropicibacter sp. S64]|uniref:sensor histidine kinase n=1 Tax=Tropicibacter sp. S64 TaxID=3415122 RepID=UPI003C7CD7CC
MVTHPIHARLDSLMRAEFGSRIEVAFRLTLVSLAAVMLGMLSDQRVLLAWLAGMLVSEGSLACALRWRRTARTARVHFRISLALYALALMVFITGPLYLIWSGIPGLVLTGALTLVATLLCKMQHWQEDRAIAVINGLQFVLAVLSIVAMRLPHVDGTINRIAVIAAAVALCAYYGMGVAAQLSRDSALRESRRRYAQSQKARALNQFVGGVAHDFNNILTAIMGNLELAGMLGSKAERDEALSEAHKAAERAAITVRQLLATSGRSRLRPEPITARELHRQMEAVLHDLLEPGITLQSAAREPDFVTFVDRDMLETVLIQLCLNAQDALQGRGNIWLHSRSQLERPATDGAPHAPPPYLAITVEDNGPGAADDSLEMLAEPFFTTKSVGQGSGLGLSAVQGFAGQSGGALLLANRDGGGFCATLLLPRA